MWVCIIIISWRDFLCTCGIPLLCLLNDAQTMDRSLRHVLRFNSTGGKYGELTLFQDVFPDVGTLHTWNIMYQTLSNTLHHNETIGTNSVCYHTFSPFTPKNQRVERKRDTHPVDPTTRAQLLFADLTKHAHFQTSWYMISPLTHEGNFTPTDAGCWTDRPYVFSPRVKKTNHLSCVCCEMFKSTSVEGSDFRFKKPAKSLNLLTVHVFFVRNLRRVSQHRI